MGSFDFGSAVGSAVEDSAAVGLVEDSAVEDSAVEDSAVGSAVVDSAEVDSAEGSAVEDSAEVGSVEVGSAAVAAAAETSVVAASADSKVSAEPDTAAGSAAGSVVGSAAVGLVVGSAADSAVEDSAEVDSAEGSAEDRMVAARDSFHLRTRRYRTARPRNIARRSPTPRCVRSPETKSYTPTRRVFLLPSPRARHLARAPLARTDASIPVSLDATRKPSRVALVSSYRSRAPRYLCLGARRRRN